MLIYLSSHQGEKDVFETDDLPEVDQIGLQQPIHDASIEIIPSNTNDAFQTFAALDERDSAIIGRESKESYVDKYNRLKAEIEDLKNNASNEIGSDVALEIDDLALKLANLKEIRSASAETKNIGDSSLIKYELFCKPDRERVMDLCRVNYLEQRIKKIENILGINEAQQEFSFLNNNFKDQSIMSIVIQLSNKVVQMDQSSLERIDARLHSVIEKLNQISEKKSSLENLNMTEKLNELYDYYVKTVQNRKTLPNIMERLQVLSDVQEKACNFSTSLADVKSVQEEIQLSVDKNSQNLKFLKELIETNSNNIRNMIADFDKRLEKLKN
ncbi:Dynactin subunit 2 [Blomia tropicalis]|nr:Dynactin subunit 2 [Blomia tropicalis]